MLSASSMAWFATVGVALHFVIAALNSKTADALLARFGLPPIPDKALPWVSLAIGMGSGFVDAFVKGMTWQTALQGAVAGLFTGAAANGHMSATGTLPPPGPPPGQLAQQIAKDTQALADELTQPVQKGGA